MLSEGRSCVARRLSVVAFLLGILSTGLGGCGFLRTELADAAPSLGIPEELLSEISSSEGIGLRRTAESIELVRLSPAGTEWAVQVLASASAADEAASVQFVAEEAPSNQPHTYVFGTAPAGTIQVIVTVPESDAEEGATRVDGGTVHEGLWLSVIYRGELEPPEVGWEFVDDRGEIVLNGNGVHP
ncbi:MAG: hypothetical protein ACR2K4_00515 [Candidatus Limnocylindria bacterium]